jgi:hypothetical protein
MFTQISLIVVLRVLARGNVIGTCVRVYITMPLNTDFLFLHFCPVALMSFTELWMKPCTRLVLLHVCAGCSGDELQLERTLWFFALLHAVILSS